MNYVSKLVVIRNPNSERQLAYALLSDGILTITDVDSNQTVVVGKTICEEGCDSFAISENGDIACASYQKNLVTIQRVDNGDIVSVQVLHPQYISACGDSFIVTTEHRQAYFVKSGEARALRKRNVAGVISVESGISLILQAQQIILLDRYGENCLQMAESVAISATLDGDSLAVGYLQGIVAVYNVHKHQPRMVISFSKDGAAQAMRWLDDHRISVLWQCFPTSERWIGEINILSGEMVIKYKIPFSGGLGTFMLDGHFCQKNGNVYDPNGIHIKTLDLLGTSRGGTMTSGIEPPRIPQAP